MVCLVEGPWWGARLGSRFVEAKALGMALTKDILGMALKKVLYEVVGVSWCFLWWIQIRLTKLAPHNWSHAKPREARRGVTFNAWLYAISCLQIIIPPPRLHSIQTIGSIMWLCQKNEWKSSSYFSLDPLLSRQWWEGQPCCLEPCGASTKNGWINETAAAAAAIAVPSATSCTNAAW